MFCQNCSAFDTSDARFCRRCGESLIEAKSGLSIFSLLRRRSFLGKNFLIRSLFDLSFQPPAPKLVKSVYGLSLFTAAALFLNCILSGLEAPPWLRRLLLLVSAPLACLLLVAFARILLELVSVLSRLEHQRELPQQKKEPKDEIEWHIG